MPSSTSSSDLRLPRLRWLAVLGGALTLSLSAMAGLELALAHHGFQPNRTDSFFLWQWQRERADRIGSRALVLVGNSRVLGDLDQGELQRATGLEPVQLGVGGASFLPVLEDLARDPAVTGTVLVNFEPQELEVNHLDLAASYVDRRGRGEGGQGWDFTRVEAVLSDELHSRLRSYADGSRPLTALLSRAIAPHPAMQYLRTTPNRSLLVDFSTADVRTLYYVRAILELPVRPLVRRGATLDQVQQVIERSLTTLEPDDTTAFHGQLASLASLVAIIQQRGGRVVFVRLPRTGYVRQIDDKRFPRRLFWDPLHSLTGVQTMDFEDVPALEQFDCPDGSHLDMHERAAFTRALVQALQLGAPH